MTPISHPVRRTIIGTVALAASVGDAQAQEIPADADLRELVGQLLVEQATLRERVAELEAQLSAERQNSAETVPKGAAELASQPPMIRTVIEPSQGLVPALHLSGDFRLRYEANSLAGPDRHRMVMRARLSALYSPTEHLSLGARLATGDPDDPNSTDVTIGGFDDDLDISLDRAFVRFEQGNLVFQGGKFDNPLTRTEMVWDGDVGVAGLHASYRPTPSLSFNAIYFAIDEDVAGDDSRMIGGEARWSTFPESDLSADVAISYLDYRLGTVGAAGIGDIRTNRFAGGNYVSDFNLLSAYVAFTASPFGRDYPVSLAAQHVRNLAAPDWTDEGTSFDLWLGRTVEPGDWRLNYGYTIVDADAVLAAFASDNIPLGSDYQQHRLAIDYVLAQGISANATYYHYRARRTDGVTSMPQDWEDRLRLNVLFAF